MSSSPQTDRASGSATPPLVPPLLRTAEENSIINRMPSVAAAAGAPLPGGASYSSGGGRSNTGMRTPSSATATITIAEQQEDDEVLQLTLRPGPSVRWDESVVDNEGLGRKSSKRCCIFHKQRAFGESSTDSSDNDSADDDDSSNDDDGDGSGGDGQHKKKIARPKTGSNDKVPDFQRFHA